MKESVQEYYGETLQSSNDLQTDACCTDGDMPRYIKQALGNVHDEVLMRYYGCGLVAPEQLRGMRILDLGSGSGRDCYTLAQLVGPTGYVLGVDMTEQQLEIANRHVEYHNDKFGYANVEFRFGHIEELDKLELEDSSFDIIISNCVINLSTDKEAVLREVHRLLKPGGEMYFSDVYSDRRIADHLVSDPILYGECLSGALYWNDFHNLAKHCGFADPRLVEDRPLAINNENIQLLIGHINFYSATYRLFKIDGLEPFCEDYGQAVRYKGTIEHHPELFALDKHHAIEKGRIFPVCGNTYRMLNESRFADHFEFMGDWDIHYGIFKGCGTDIPYDNEQSNNGESGGSCC